MSMRGVEFVGGPMDGRLYEMPQDPEVGHLITVNGMDIRTNEITTYIYEVEVSPHSEGMLYLAVHRDTERSTLPT